MHTKINIVKKLSGAYHKVWYEKSVLPGLNIGVYNSTGIRFVLEPRTRTNTTWIFSFFSHSTLPLPVTSSLVGAAASYLLPHWKRNVQKTRREIAFVLSFTDFWSYHDASDSNAVQSGKSLQGRKEEKYEKNPSKFLIPFRDTVPIPNCIWCTFVQWDILGLYQISGDLKKLHT